MQAMVSGEQLKKQGVIEVTVSNTAANEFVRKDALIKTHPKEIVGPYHEMSLKYEKRAPNFKFGSVKIIKFKDK